MKRLLAISLLSTSALSTLAVPGYFQGFETDASGWTVDQGLTRVASGGGTLGLTAASGGFYGELLNNPDGYDTGYGNAGYTFLGGASSVYNGPFYQAIDIYVDPSWAASSTDGIWIDMTPYHADVNNFGAEHNFRVRSTGSGSEIRVDGQTTPIATISDAGWYTFKMTWSKAANPSDPALTDLEVISVANGTVLGSTQVSATSPGGPFPSSDLGGNGYIWLTLWKNGFAGDILGIDNARTDNVPDAGATLGLFGLGLAALATIKNRRK